MAQEIFAALITIIFIMEALLNIGKVSYSLSRNSVCETICYGFVIVL